MSPSCLPAARGSFRRGHSAALCLALTGTCAAVAQTPPLPDTVVTATRTATRADELVSDVTVIDRPAIEASTARSLPELLARVAGVQMASSGGLGKTSGVFIRGTESRHTILLVDGVRLGSATAGIPSWEGIPIEMIERIEVLKGPASALYGSEGVGGVVQVFTRQGRAGFHPYGTLAVGSERHRLASVGLSAGQGRLTYALGAQHLQERGISATNPRVPFGSFNPDRDPFRQDAFNASARYDLGNDWSVDGAVLYSEGESAFDDGPTGNARSALRAFTGHAGVKGRLGSAWRTELRVSRGEDTNNDLEATFPGAFKTGQTEWRWQNNIATPLGEVLAGLEQRMQAVSGSTDFTVSRRTINSVFVGLSGNAGNHSWQGNLRRDANSQFDDVSTGFAGYGYRISPAWRVHASHGTSFVAPSFNQLYFPRFGNPALQPERGRNTDLGVSWSAGDHTVKLVRFDNRIRGFMTNTTLPVNIPRARIEGWTLSHEARLGALATRASVDLLDPRNEGNGRQLPRRAERQLTLGADYAVGAWRLGASLLHVGARFDDAANTAPLPAYTTADLYADWQLAREMSLQLKFNNVADKRYETALGYNQPGRGAYLTLRWQPK